MTWTSDRKHTLFLAWFLLGGGSLTAAGAFALALLAGPAVVFVGFSFWFLVLAESEWRDEALRRVHGIDALQWPRSIEPESRIKEHDGKVA